MCALELAGDLLETEPARPPARVRTAEDRDQAAAFVIVARLVASPP